MCTIYDRVETTLRELKFPPLQGGPTKDDIIGLLEAVLDNYDEPEESEQVQELRQDIDDLYDGINQAIDELEDLEDIDELNGIIEDLRRL
jgi:flagellin-specific chaperone FliS